MSANSRKGWSAEHAVELWLRDHGHDTHRPRTTSVTGADLGDHRGLPLVLSTKDHRRLELSSWVDELAQMVARSPWSTGLLIHKRRGRADAGQWYVTSTLELALPQLDAYVRSLRT